jgi:hypothetical protein
MTQAQIDETEESCCRSEAGGQEPEGCSTEQDAPASCCAPRPPVRTSCCASSGQDA